MSHLLQMRGLKQEDIDKKWAAIGSHLLQMRGLKHRELEISFLPPSHLLQMRGLKPYFTNMEAQTI